MPIPDSERCVVLILNDNHTRMEIGVERRLFYRHLTRQNLG
jgi:hypothetical protein